MKMEYIIEEKRTLGWDKKVIMPLENLIKLYKYDQNIINYSTQPYESILYEHSELITQGRTSFMIIHQKNKRVFRCESKDSNDIIFTKLFMMQDQFILNSALSQNYKATRESIKEMKATKLEKMATYLMTLCPLLFREINEQLDKFKKYNSNKMQPKEDYLTLYTFLKGLIYELNTINDRIYENCTSVINENSSKDKEAKRRFSTYDKNYKLKTMKCFNSLNIDNDDEIKLDEKEKSNSKKNKNKIEDIISSSPDDRIETRATTRKISSGLRRSNDSFSKNIEYNTNLKFIMSQANMFSIDSIQREYTISQANMFSIDSIQREYTISQANMFSIDSIQREFCIAQVNMFSIDSIQREYTISQANMFSIDSIQREYTISQANMFSIDSIQREYTISQANMFSINNNSHKKPIIIEEKIKNIDNNHSISQENIFCINNSYIKHNIPLANQNQPAFYNLKTLISFPNMSYDFFPRINLKYHTKLPLDYIAQYLNDSNNKSASISFPITLNEPISFLQKQCEKMVNSHYLSYAHQSLTKQMKLCYISGFILGELSLGLNRFMEPLSPLQGETYEYYDNQRKYRFFASQISSSISAFIGESNDFTINGDTNRTISINIPQCSIETNEITPTTINFNSTLSPNDTYIYSHPIKVMKYKSILSTTIEYKGSFNIYEKGLKDNYAEISIEENNKINGVIYVDKKKMITLKGSLRDIVLYEDIKTGKTETLWKLNTKEKYLMNQFGRIHYYLPRCSYNLNNYNQKLFEKLPKTDSRKRMEIREYEDGNIIIAQKLKNEAQKKNNHPSDYFKEKEGKYLYSNNYWP